VQLRLNDVSAALASDSYGRDGTFIIFRSDQRAIGEFMVTERKTQNGKRPDCLGYSEFIEALARLDDLAAGSTRGAENSPVASWARRFTAGIDTIAAATPGAVAEARLVRVQRRLIDLIDLLDSERTRYPRPDLRGKLPWPEMGTKPLQVQAARFIWPWGNPWGGVDEWGQAQPLTCSVEQDDERLYIGRLGLLGGHPEIRVIYRDGWFTITAGTARGRRIRSIDGSLRSRRARRALDDLLDRYDRPLVNEATKPFRAVEWIRRLVVPR
jgi:hypothetical protein